jgi:hypothetical protein
MMQLRRARACGEHASERSGTQRSNQRRRSRGRGGTARVDQRRRSGGVVEQGHCAAHHAPRSADTGGQGHNTPGHTPR